MTKEEIVLNRIAKKAKSPVYFKEPERQDYWNPDGYNASIKNYEDKISHLKSLTDTKNIVREIIRLCQQFGTRYGKNRYQCSAGHYRSAQDIWRIYIYYFGEIDIFSIMRALYKLAIEEEVISTHLCTTVRKQVFWNGRGYVESHLRADLGVALREWKDIGLNNG